MHKRSKAELSLRASFWRGLFAFYAIGFVIAVILIREAMRVE